MTFEGKADWFWKETSYIELIALYAHPKNSNHLRSHSRARMALDHSRLDLENKFLENKSGRIFCFRQVYFTKPCQQIWGCVNQPFNAFYTPHLRWNSTFYHTDLGQNTAFHNFSMFRTINRGLLAKPFKKFPKSPIRPAGSHFWRAPNLQWTLLELRFNIIIFFFFYLKVL